MRKKQTEVKEEPVKKATKPKKTEPKTQSKTQQEEKPRKRFVVTTKFGKTYSIEADFLKYDWGNKDSESVIFFKKEINDQTNVNDNSHIFDVAFIKAEDVNVIGIETFLKEDTVPITRDALIRNMSSSLFGVCCGLLTFIVLRKMRI